MYWLRYCEELAETFSNKHYCILIYYLIYFSGLVHYDPLRASSYIPLPPVIQKRKACINVKNDDEKCFLWSVLAALHPAVKNVDRVAKYTPFEAEIDMTGISYPVATKDVDKVESMNNISINVFGLEDNKTVFPMRISKKTDSEHHIDLLYISDSDINHYVLIKNMSRLIKSQLSLHKCQTFICSYCLHGCKTKEILDRHVERCKMHDAQRVKLPEKNDKKGRDKVKFTKTEYQLRLPFVIYADFESILLKHDVCKNNSEKSWTLKYQTHEACGYGLYTVCSDKRFYRAPEVYHGADSAEKFLDHVLNEAAELRALLKKKMLMKKLTREQWREYNTTHTCHICKKNIKSDEKKVRDHDHLTGEYRGPAHNICNLQYRIDPEKVKIPCIIHNLKGYDAHLILSAVKPHHGEVKCIPNNMEKYTSFTVGGVTFIDSCQFMQSSLEQLASNLDAFPETNKYLESQYVDGSQVENDDISGKNYFISLLKLCVRLRC